MMWQAGNAEVANFWNDLGFLWPFFVVLVLHFSMIYTENNWLKNKVTYIALYLPAILFTVIDGTTDLINGQPILQYWGYEDTSPATLAYNLSTIWVSILPVIALLLCVRFYFKTQDEAKKKQSKFITLGFSIPIITYLVTNIMFPILGIEIPNLGHFATLFFGIFVSYAILKYELFTLDAALAAENIISTMPDSLILADSKGKILRVNNGTLTFLGYTVAEFKGKPISNIFREEEQCETLLNSLREKRIVRNSEFTCKTKNGEMKRTYFFQVQLSRAKQVET